MLTSGAALLSPPVALADRTIAGNATAMYNRNVKPAMRALVLRVIWIAPLVAGGPPAWNTA
jgi:hypothetical protein